MGKLVYLLLLIFAINVSMVVFLGISAPTSSIWLLITNPSDWGNLSFIDYFKDSFVLIGGTAIILGALWLKNDTLVFAGYASIFFSFGASLYELWQVLNGYSGSFGLELGTGITFATLIVSPIILLYIYTILSFWRGRD